LFKEDAFAEAKMHLQLAHEILPDYSGYPSPALVLSQIYERENNQQARLEQLKIMLENQQHDYDSAMLLARHTLDQGDVDLAHYYVDRALAVSPYRIDVHELGARIAQEKRDPAMAVREYEVLVDLDFNDPVEARTNLAAAYLDNGQAAKARRNIISALEIAPSYQRAQQVLLQAVDASQ